MSDLRSTVLRRVEELAPDTIALTQALVRIDSRNPTLPGVIVEEVIGGETRVNDVLAESYRAAGLTISRVAQDPRRSNLVGIRQGTGGGRSLALNGHVDTVAAAHTWALRGTWQC